MTSAGTVAGMILGTAAYMSPEQARGTAVDRRADVWAFGCVLWEMLTGEQLFRGQTVSDTLAAVLRATPPWATLPAGTPPSVRRLVRRCLEKDPDRRLHAIADARLEIDDAISGEPEGTEIGAESPGRRGGALLPWVLTGLLAVVAVVAMMTGGTGADRTLAELHVSVAVPQRLEIASGQAGAVVCDLSPDGRLLAFTGREKDTIRLYLRPLGTTTLVEVAESDSAADPAFSPDGQWVAFVGPAKLVKASVQGGTPIELADAPTPRGITWLDEETIVFAPTYNSGLSRVRADGGETELLTTPDPEKNERTHRWPHALPGGRAVLYTIGTQDKPGNYEDASIAVLDVETGKSRVLLEGGSIARYVSPGHLLYSRGGELLAVPFDVDRLEITGPPAPVLDGVAGDVTSGVVHFAVSGDGTLMYIPAGKESDLRNLIWVDREGRTEKIAEISRPFLGPHLSPDGSRVALTVGPGLGDGDIWILDLTSGQRTRLTFDTFNIGPVWSPDGEHVVYGVTQGGAEGVAWKRADGSAESARILRTEGRFASIPDAWIPGSKTIAFTRGGGSGGGDIFSVTLGDSEQTPILDGPDLEGGATFSPDGTWLAYTSNESGRFQIYVRPYPGPGGKWQISAEGGKGAVWSHDGKEIDLLAGDTTAAVRAGVRARRGAVARLRRDSRRQTVPDGGSTARRSAPAPAQPGPGLRDAPAEVGQQFFGLHTGRGRRKRV
jgi:serine/threonine-protein kinase